MFVEEVCIDGFKSYATRTVVPQFDKYFNAITGLNGSGKSNILDSICFVLGITNLSQVRLHIKKEKSFFFPKLVWTCEETKWKRKSFLEISFFFRARMRASVCVLVSFVISFDFDFDWLRYEAIKIVFILKELLNVISNFWNFSSLLPLSLSLSRARN